jgi:hypothetical protein
MTIWQFPEGMTLEEAKTWLLERLDDGVSCPCCGQFAKRYKRKLNSSMAHALVLFYRHVGAQEEYVHVPSIPELRVSGRPGGGDWAKLALWGLVEEKEEERDDGSKRAGLWRMTHLGVRFVRNQMRVPRCVFLYDGAVMGFDPLTTVSIEDALGDHFNYRELMGYPPDMPLEEPQVYVPPTRPGKRRAARMEREKAQSEAPKPKPKPKPRKTKSADSSQLDLFYRAERPGPFARPK